MSPDLKGDRPAGTLLLYRCHSDLLSTCSDIYQPRRSQAGSGQRDPSGAMCIYI